MIVVDTNVVAYLLIPGEHTDVARAVFARDPVWAAPLLWRSELRNVLAPYLRRGDMDVVHATMVQALAEECLLGREHVMESAAVLELANTSGRSAYDCEFVMVARVLRVPLVTFDRQLLRTFPETAVSASVFAAGSPGR